MRTVLDSQIKGGPGAISSSRCQTTRALPGKPGRREIFSFVDERNGMLGRGDPFPRTHSLSTQSRRSHHGEKSFAPEPEQKRTPT
jgi:hypothetical protein